MKVEKISRRLFLRTIQVIEKISVRKNTINTILILEKNQLKKLYLKLIP